MNTPEERAEAGRALLPYQRHILKLLTSGKRLILRMPRRPSSYDGLRITGAILDSLPPDKEARNDLT